MDAPESTAVVETVTPDVTVQAAPAPEKAAPPAAPASEPKAAEQPASGSESKQLLTRQEARRQLRKESSDRRARDEKAKKDRETAASAQPDVRGKKHREDGTFLPADMAGETKQEAAGAPPAATKDTTPPAAEKPQGEEQKTGEGKAAADKPAGAANRVEIDPKHPVAGMGVPVITTGSEQEAQVVRALLNGAYTRRQENEALKAELAKEQSRARELQDQVITHESNREARKKFTSSPEYQDRVNTYQAILDEHGQARADEYWRGVETDYNKFLATEREQQTAAVRQKEEQAHAERWRTHELGHAKTAFGDKIAALPGFERWFVEEIELFNDRLEKGRFPHLDVEPRNQQEAEHLDKATRAEFRRQLGQRLRTEPTFAEAYRARTADSSKQKADEAKARAMDQKELDRQLDQARREGAEAAKREAAQARVDTPPSPIASLPTPDSRRTGVRTGPEPVDTNGMSGGTLRKHAKREARELGRRRLQQQ
ncbi:MAG: hypothetical protein AB7Q29_16035 [Vicinamibacterales bacterium]